MGVNKSKTKILLSLFFNRKRQFVSNVLHARKYNRDFMHASF